LRTAISPERGFHAVLHDIDHRLHGLGKTILYYQLPAYPEYDEQEFVN
jgi:hypothetical protein